MNTDNNEFNKKIIEEFLKWISRYDLNNEKINLKKNHSLRVMELSIKYAKKLGFNNKDVILAQIIGLLHDIGRFEQLKIYNSFNDNNIDHAKLSVKILFEDGLIKNFWNKEKDYEIIKFAIENHNKLFIPKCKDKKALKFAKLIRDVDKLDIIYLLGFLGELNLKPTEEKISNEIIKSISNNKIANYSFVHSTNDSIALKFAFTFDINYDICLEELKQNLYYYYKQINFNYMFKEIYEQTNRYIEIRIKK